MNVMNLLNEQLANFAEGFAEDSNTVVDIIVPPLLVMYYINYCISYTNMGSTSFSRSYGRTHEKDIFMVYLLQTYLKDSLYCVLSSQCHSLYLSSCVRFTIFASAPNKYYKNIMM